MGFEVVFKGRKVPRKPDRFGEMWGVSAGPWTLSLKDPWGLGVSGLRLTPVIAAVVLGCGAGVYGAEKSWPSLNLSCGNGSPREA